MGRAAGRPRPRVVLTLGRLAARGIDTCPPSGLGRGDVHAEGLLHILLERPLQDGLLAQRTVAARRPPRLQPLVDALTVEDVAARQHRARGVVVVAGEADGAA